MDSIYEAVGNTPLVRLQRVHIDNEVECQVFAKCEFMNPGGSVKDRIGRRMFLKAEEEGIIKPGDTVVEATSGNAGIGLAFMAACKAYNMVITLPEKMSNEKVSVLKSLGAEIIRTPTEAPTMSEESHYMVARKIVRERPNAYILDQYGNINNPDAHYYTTGKEIYDQTEGKLDYVFAGVGTGGTISGVSRYLKEKIPDVKIIGIDPYGSILAQPEEKNETDVTIYHVEGIGYDFIPDALTRDLVDEWVKTDDTMSFEVARELISKEGMLCGGSCGSAMAGAFKYLKEKNLHKNKDIRCVVILPDSIRNYLSKFCADDWMVKHGFLAPETLEVAEHPLYGKKISDLDLQPISHYDDRFTVNDAVDAFDKGSVAVPLLANGKILGIVTRDSLFNGVMKKGLENANSASKCITKDFVLVPYDVDLSVVDTLLKTEEIVFSEQKDEEGRTVAIYAVSKLELLRLFRKMTKELI